VLDVEQFCLILELALVSDQRTTQTWQGNCLYVQRELPKLPYQPIHESSDIVKYLGSCNVDRKHRMDASLEVFPLLDVQMVH